MKPTSKMLHEDLAELYRGKSTNIVLINQYWDAIEKAEAEEGE